MQYLIKNIEELRSYISNITPSADFDNFTSEIQAATIEFIIPYIGGDLYNALANYHNTKEEERLELIDAENLVQYLQPAIANYTALKYTPSSDTFFTALGLQTVKGENQTAAFSYQKQDRMNKYAEVADTFMDRALTFLENNKENYPLWIGNTQEEINLFTDTQCFSYYFDIGNSRRTYLRLLPTIRKVEQLYIRPVLGIHYYNGLKEALKEGVLNSETKELLKQYIRPALAQLTISKALRELTFRTKDNAVCVASFYENSKDSSETFFEKLIQQTASDGEAYLNLLVKKLAENNKDTEPQAYVYQNSNKKKHFMI